VFRSGDVFRRADRIDAEYGRLSLSFLFFCGDAEGERLLAPPSLRGGFSRIGIRRGQSYGAKVFLTRAADALIDVD
jgi:hypothetical protein